MRYPGSEYPTKPFISYRSTNNLTYPVNVGRNIARQTATSHFVFPSDIELYPSPGMLKNEERYQFIRLPRNMCTHKYI